MTPKEIKAKRLQLKLTQVDLGRALGVAGNTVALWERGESTPESPLMLKMALDYMLTEQWLEMHGQEKFEQLQQRKEELQAILAQPLLEKRRIRKSQPAR